MCLCVTIGAEPSSHISLRLSSVKLPVRSSRTLIPAVFTAGGFNSSTSPTGIKETTSSDPRAHQPTESLKHDAVMWCCWGDDLSTRETNGPNSNVSFCIMSLCHLSSSHGEVIINKSLKSGLPDVVISHYKVLDIITWNTTLKIEKVCSSEDRTVQEAWSSQCCPGFTPNITWWPDWSIL